MNDKHLVQADPKAEWVCYKDGCECEHEWVFTLVFALTITGHRTRAIICDKCRHPRRPIMLQTDLPARETD